MVYETPRPQPAARIHSTKRITRKSRKRDGDAVMNEQTVMGPTPLRPLDKDAFVWTTIDEIGSVQAMYDAPSCLTLDSEELWREQWEPRHVVMENHLRRWFYIVGLSGIVRAFCTKCLLWLHVKGGAVIPRPFSETHHTFERNETLHWDFLTLGEFFGSSRYVLGLKDEATHFVELVACDVPTRYGVPTTWICDLWSHCKTNAIAELNRRLKQRHLLAVGKLFGGAGQPRHFASSKDVGFGISSERAGLASSINHLPVPSLVNKAPIEFFTGFPGPDALDTGEWCVATLTQPQRGTEQRLANLRASIAAMHKEMKVKRTKQTQRYRIRPHYHQQVNFWVGDYVLRSRVHEKQHANKLREMWVGPYRVVGSSDY
ncbi:hypothetical protein PHMEG_0003432 [Phytophthora megakarya]|uniref:Integrase zinc-binding domain-containing protein n=1 Tax=Phytophthora megakarya TaxID=4795 RepID=A0A225WWE9_9STRA|nr:hypothetical protein PHMEG_0003432 [Phytophthora megakarya]